MNTFRMQVFSENGQAKSGISQRHRRELPAFNQNDNENEKDMIYEMNKKNDPKQDGLNARNILIGLIIGIVICALLTLCTSCTTTKYVELPVVHNDTVWQNHTLHDSIWVHDSTYIYENGDTFLMEKWHTKYVMKEVHDTTYISKTDSVPTPYPVEVINEVEKPLTWWQQTKMHVGAIVIFGLLIALFINIFIRIFKKYFLP